MRILHVYSHDNPRLAKYVNLLSQAMPADVECVFADNASDFRLAIKDFKPEIVHQHGHPLTNIIFKERLVVSPHGETIDIAKAYAVIVRSPYELNCYDTERKELVRNPLITKTITFEEAAAAIHKIYQRIIDSHPLELMDLRTRHLLALLLKAGLLGDKGWVSDDKVWRSIEAAIGNRQGRVGNCNFRHLFIYAQLEGVADIVERGIGILGIDSPEKPVIDCYLPHGYKIPEPLPKATIPELLRDIDSHGISLLRLSELAKLLYDDNLDEAALLKQLEDARQQPLLQLLLQILSEQILLTEGFMPCPPLNNNFTEALRHQLENHLRIV